MLNGKIPSQHTINLMDKDFILHADHGSNASAFTARVVASTNADIHGAITAGIAANNPIAVAINASAIPGATTDSDA